MSIWGTPVLLGGGGSAGWHRVRFYTFFGGLITTEFVADGEDCTYGSGADWSTTQGGAAVSGITENVHSDLDLYSTLSTLLINSIQEDILTEEFADDYTSGAAWGDFLLFGSGYEKRDGALYIPTTASAQYGLGAANTVVTFYTVAKEASVVSGDPNMICAWYAESSGNCPNFYNRSGHIMTSVWSNDTDTGVSALDYHALAISLSSGKQATYYIDGNKYGQKNYAASGANIMIGAVGPNHNVRPNSCFYKYVAVVSGTETDETIIANMQSIMSNYGLN